MFAWHLLIDCNCAAKFAILQIPILLHFEIWRIWCIKHAIHRCFLRLTLMRDILRIKHLLHDASYHNLRILNQYANKFNSIHTYHICDCVCYTDLLKIGILLMSYMCSLYVQIFDICCIVFRALCLQIRLFCNLSLRWSCLFQSHFSIHFLMKVKFWSTNNFC